MITEKNMYHLSLSEPLHASYAILPGDPGRVEQISRYLEQPEFIVSNREYTTWRGFLNKEPVLVTSTGIGGPSAAIAVEELFSIGVRNFIRVGTCGGMHRQIRGGDIVIATGAIRMEGTSRHYLPIEFPAVADFSIVSALKKTCPQAKTGVVQSKDSFYGQHSPDRMPVAAELNEKWQAWIRGGCLASEMECASLFTVAQSLGARAGAVLSVLWNQEREKAGLPNLICEDTEPAIRAAVGAVRILIESGDGSALF